jgi:WhiB family redox-sensing transcriptional regulator
MSFQTAEPMTDQRWSEAACKDMNTEIFFPDDYTQTGKAKAVCTACPIKQFCFEWAVENKEHGVWGGHYFTWRSRIKKPKQWVYVAKATPEEIEQRITVIRQMTDEGLSSKEISVRLGVSQRTVTENMRKIA